MKLEKREDYEKLRAEQNEIIKTAELLKREIARQWIDSRPYKVGDMVEFKEWNGDVKMGRLDRTVIGHNAHIQQ